MDPMHVFFFRGLSTYGHDQAKFSILDFGPVYKHFSRELSRRGIHFHPVLNMGVGGLNDVAERAREFVRRHPLVTQTDHPFHFLGHSAGGVVARLLVPHMNERLRSCLTVATPHRGARLAEVCAEMNALYPGSARAMRAVGYRVEAKRDFFLELTPKRLGELFADESANSNVSRGSIVCAEPRGAWCLPLQLFYQVRAFKEFTAESDGVVEKSSQAWGDVVAELEIDHFRQAGFFDRGRRFERLCDAIAAYFRSVQV